MVSVGGLGDKTTDLFLPWHAEASFYFNCYTEWMERASRVAQWWRIHLQCRSLRRQGFNPWVRKIPWGRAWQPIPIFLLENPLDRWAWQAIVHRVAKSRTQLKWPSTHAWMKYGRWVKKNPRMEIRRPDISFVTNYLDSLKQVNMELNCPQLSNRGNLTRLYTVLRVTRTKWTIRGKTLEKGNCCAFPSNMNCHGLKSV